jgi:hypothetical protein
MARGTDTKEAKGSTGAKEPAAATWVSLRKNRRCVMAQAQQIKEHMEVCGSDGAHVGTVDCMRGSDKIVLTKSDVKSGGEHHVIPFDWVENIDD